MQGNFRLGQEHLKAGSSRSTCVWYGCAALPWHSPQAARSDRPSVRQGRGLARPRPALTAPASGASATTCSVVTAARDAADREERCGRGAARAAREEEAAARRTRGECEELELGQRAHAALAEPQRAGERDEAPGRRSEQHARPVDAQERREVVGEAEAERSEDARSENEARSPRRRRRAPA